MMRKVLSVCAMITLVCMIWAAPTKTANSNLPAFTATDLSGKTMTNSDFKNYSVTMINIWATWCSPCVSEMPELAELATKLPSKANMMTICLDSTSDDGAAAAKQIVASVNGTFTSIIPDTALTTWISSSIQAVPTTIFVDSNGKMLGQPIIGVPRGKASDVYLKRIQQYTN